MKKDGTLDNDKIRLFVSQYQDRNGYKPQRQDRVHTFVLYLVIAGIVASFIWMVLAFATNRM